MLLTRAAGLEDLKPISKLCSRALVKDPDDAGSLAELLWGSPGGRPDMRLVAEDEHRVVGVVMATLGTPPSGPPVGHVDLLAVSPEAQGQGIGRKLLDAVERAIKGAGATEARAGGNAPCYAWPGVDLEYSAAIGLFESAGYRACGDAVNMIVNLSEAPLDTTADERRLADNGISIRPLRASDEPTFSSWVEMFWSDDWAWEASRALVKRGAGCHVALRGSDLVAFGAYGPNRASWFGPMGTVPGEQRQGLGSVLLRRCLADLHRGGMVDATIGWVGPTEFYRRTVGATLGRKFRFYKKDL
jgi:GNAT superfamily N-acetyltransferase